MEEIIIDPILKRGIESMGYKEWTPIQKEVIPLLKEGKDIIGQAKTGTGKTATFGLPILEKIDCECKKVQALIICPTRELAMQIVEELRMYARYMQGIRILPVYGGCDINQQIRNLKGVQIVVGTPGRLLDHIRRHTIKPKQLQMVVLDEADEMLDMGFREDIETILKSMNPEIQTCLFSATMPEEIIQIAKNYQNNPQFIKIESDTLTIDLIKQYYSIVSKEMKYNSLIQILNQNYFNKCILFCNTKKRVSLLVEQLLKDGYNVDGLHGDLNQKQRNLVMNKFRKGQIRILVCTDIAARGIDVKEVQMVINYDIPDELEFYIHRIGRTGRAGKKGVSYTLCTKKEISKIHQIEKLCHIHMIEKKLFDKEEYRKYQQRQLFEQILKVTQEENLQSYISPVYRFCKSNSISPEQFMAASVKLLLERNRYEKGNSGNKKI